MQDKRKTKVDDCNRSVCLSNNNNKNDCISTFETFWWEGGEGRGGRRKNVSNKKAWSQNPHTHPKFEITTDRIKSIKSLNHISLVCWWKSKNKLKKTATWCRIWTRPSLSLSLSLTQKSFWTTRHTAFDKSNLALQSEDMLRNEKRMLFVANTHTRPRKTWTIKN